MALSEKIIRLWRMISTMKKWYLLLLVFVLITPFSYVHATSENEPEVEIKPSKNYYVRKFFLFPLELPSYAIKIATLPIGVLLKFAEDTGAVEKTLNFLSSKDKTLWVYPIVEGGAGSGFGGGLGVRDTDLFHRGYLLGASYKIHIDMSQQAMISFGKPHAFELFGRPVSYSIGSKYQRGHEYNFYGIGNDSARSNQSLFGGNDINSGAAISIELLDNFSISPYFGVDAGNSRPKGGSSSLPSVQDTFLPAELNGFDKWVDYLDFGVRLAHDTRDSIEATEKGGLRDFTFMRFYGFNRSGYNYNHYQLEAKQYFRLFMPRQVLLLRANLVVNTPTGGGQIPFWRLATLDVNSPLRGFASGRFRDNDSLLFNVEYRYPVWHLMDGVLFYDTGRVFNKLSNISLDDIKYSVGGGLHFTIPNIAFFKFYMAYGGEGLNYIFGASKPL